MRRLISAWNHFFYTPISTAGIGLYRILYGLVVIDSLIGKYMDHDMLYGANGLIRPQTLSVFFQSWELKYNFFYLVPERDPELTVFFAILLIVAIAFTVGFLTRLNNIILFAGLLALANRNPLANNAGDELIRIIGFFLIFSQAGAAYSFDRWWSTREGTADSAAPLLASPWAQRLVQLQLAYVYLDTVWLKMHGLAWLDGTAIYYALNYLELRRVDLRFIFNSLWSIRLATWSVILVESSMFSLVWWPKTRNWCLLGALLLHLGIALSMHLVDLQVIMLVTLILFVEPRWVTGAIGSIRDSLTKLVGHFSAAS